MIVATTDGREIRLEAIWAIAIRYSQRMGLEVEELAAEITLGICDWMARHSVQCPDFEWIAQDSIRRLNGHRSRGVEQAHDP